MGEQCTYFWKNLEVFKLKLQGFRRKQVKYMHLSINRSNLVRFSKSFFIQKAYENRHLAKYWVRNCAPCAPTSAAPAVIMQKIVALSFSTLVFLVIFSQTFWLF